MRLLFLFEYPSLNGGERSFLANIDRLRGLGCELHAAAPAQGDLAAALARRNLPVHSFTLHDQHGVRLPKDAIVEQLQSVVQSVSPTLIHANSLAMSRLLGAAAPLLGRPCMGHVRDIVKLSRSAVNDLNQLDRLIFVSHAACDWHQQQGAEASKSFVVYNGVDADTFSPRAPTGSLAAELGLPSSTPIVGGIGQIGMRKGWDTLLQAMAKLPPDLSPAVVIVGERHSQKDEAIEYEASLHRDGKRLAPPVHFVGRRADVPALMNEFTMLVHPARQEPLGRVLLEAAAAGLPIVATDVGGTREIFPPDESAALLVGPDDPSAVANAIVSVLTDHELCAQLGASARRRALQAFSPNLAAGEMFRHFSEVGFSGDRIVKGLS